MGKKGRGYYGTRVYEHEHSSTNGAMTIRHYPQTPQTAHTDREWMIQYVPKTGQDEISRIYYEASSKRDDCIQTLYPPSTIWECGNIDEKYAVPTLSVYGANGREKPHVLD